MGADIALIDGTVVTLDRDVPDAAYLGFNEDEKGTLEPGKLADVTVLSDDPRAVAPEDLADLDVEYTVVGGEVVYDAERGHVY